MDEPSTGLDPTLYDLSNNECFKLIKFPLGLVFLIPITMLDLVFSAHSMEEAEHLCDRVGFYEVSIADVFHAVKVARARLPVYAWGLSLIPPWKMSSSRSQAQPSNPTRRELAKATIALRQPLCSSINISILPFLEISNFNL
jgi:hypothetical protein